MNTQKLVIKYVKKIAMQLDSIHSFEHFIFVANNAKIIAKEENIGAELAYIAGLLHDIGRIKYKGKWVKESIEKNHGTISAEMARKYLKTIFYDCKSIDQICLAIKYHVKPKTQKNKLGKILWDADKLWIFRKETSNLRKRYLIKNGLTQKEAETRIIYDKSFFYPLFYTKKAKELSNNLLKKTGEKLYVINSTEWNLPFFLEKYE